MVSMSITSMLPKPVSARSLSSSQPRPPAPTHSTRQSFYERAPSMLSERYHHSHLLQRWHDNILALAALEHAKGGRYSSHLLEQECCCGDLSSSLPWLPYARRLGMLALAHTTRLAWGGGRQGRSANVEPAGAPAGTPVSRVRVRSRGR